MIEVVAQAQGDVAGIFPRIGDKEPVGLAWRIGFGHGGFPLRFLLSASIIEPE